MRTTTQAQTGAVSRTDEAGPRRPPARLAVLSDDPWIRSGIGAGARGEGFDPVECAVTGASPDEARAIVGADVVLVDLDTPDVWDRWSGIGTVRRVGAAAVPPRAVIAWSTDGERPLLRLRAFEAGATDVLTRRTLGSFRSVQDLLLGASRATEPRPGPTDLANARLRPGGSVNVALDLARSIGGEAVFAPGLALADTGLTRRTAARLRREVSRAARLETAAHRVGGGPVRDVSVPTWREVATFVNLVRGECSDDEADTLWRWSA